MGNLPNLDWHLFSGRSRGVLYLLPFSRSKSMRLAVWKPYQWFATGTLVQCTQYVCVACRQNRLTRTEPISLSSWVTEQPGRRQGLHTIVLVYRYTQYCTGALRPTNDQGLHALVESSGVTACLSLLLTTCATKPITSRTRNCLS